MVDQAFLRLEGVSHGYGNITILNKANFTLPSACLVALTAPSGAGKSTLLHIAGLLERPNAGEVYFGSQAGWAMEEAERTKLRRHQIGFIFQFHHLLPEFNALENITLPLLIAGKSKQEAQDRSKSLLEKIGLSHRAKHLPAELSGGEQQRIALARALANRPKILLADEPTGNLDPKTADIVFNLFVDLVREEGASALIVTHSEALAEKCDQRHQLVAGKVERR